jgi:uncharacterized RDD family membrane protein YckC
VTHYEVIGVDPDASKDEIRDAYRARLEELQAELRDSKSEKVRDAARQGTAELKAAWQVLADPVQRQRYDAQLSGDGEAVDEVGSDGLEVDEEEGAAPARRAQSAGAAPDGMIVVGQDRRGRPILRRQPRGVPGAEAAPLGRRAMAMFIDIVFAGALIQLLALVQVAGANLAVFVAVEVGLVLLLILYFVVPTARTGQTFGKRRVYIMTVDAETGDLPTFSQALRRYIIPIVLIAAVPVLSTLGLMLALFAGISWMLIDTRVSLLDRIARTRVVLARYTPERA